MTSPSRPSDISPAGGSSYPVAGAPFTHPLVGPAVGLCALTATAHALGASWLASPVMGLPAGMWLIGMGIGAPHAIRKARRAARSREMSLGQGVSAGGSLPTARAWPRSGFWKNAADYAAARMGEFAEWAQDHGFGGERLPGMCGLVRWPRRSLRVGLALDDAARQALIKAPGSLECEWVMLPGGDEAPTELMRRHGLDALVRDREAGPEVFTAERAGREATWYDWSSRRPLAYTSIFPMHVDCARVSLAGLILRLDRDAALARTLVEAAAALARAPHRLGLPDRLAGRGPFQDGGALVPQTDPAVSRDPAEACLKDLAFRLQSFELTAVPTAAQRATARVVSAWLATRPLAEDAEADITGRRRGLEAAAQIAGDEPEVMLRLAAVRFAALDDDAGYDALWRADRILRDREVLPGLDQTAFLQAELDFGAYGPMTLGRAAAGICLLCATTPVERIPYVRDDLIDDMRYSGWLVGRDQDRAMLLEIFRRLERIRRSERMGLPSAQAA